MMTCDCLQAVSDHCVVCVLVRGLHWPEYCVGQRTVLVSFVQELYKGVQLRHLHKQYPLVNNWNKQTWLSPQPPANTLKVP